ncbi:MAG: hypothetical protein A3I71_01275 [Omnitrophica WOR_2 bacterium RIFCSPLOWO2_02_FULL_63_16]|nr:MAG: hypothetical protein A3B73_01950 [Omnitrophica WOR_2 bacterium RIFCSPHIGHO2_02_FULL_63_39]OGX45782.1 MAG: hypothetical protein A3I71_01275 [Omnitrophica WOR_2 bacterium RIFCSPLOWO2_02_FULL_63_16]OGX49376.1 MAG: hypothetical protein A3G88_06125 [Omnitrophica WOR_2 bacterium RIFCSPLOWO2_12_FULL_63_16]
MQPMEDRLVALHAEVCKAMANPTRLKILDALRQGEQSVQALAKRLKVRKANLSQHLAILRQRGIAATRREGLNIYYRCANPKMLKACEILREVLLEQLAEGGRLMEQASQRPSARRARHSAAATMAAASEE